MQTDPAKGASPWKRGVISGEQVLVCPQCQDQDPEWSKAFDRCPNCGSTRLVVVMGSVICKECEHDWPATA